MELRAEQRRVVIQAERVIVADHPQAPGRGMTVSDPAHLAALWQLTLAQRTPPPVAWRLASEATVEVRPLSAYEALVS
ncbi:MAG: hypothetical protein ACRETL_06665 [Gammaproteobacteria bacterium]